MGSLLFRFDTFIIPFLVYLFNSFIVHSYEQSVNSVEKAPLPGCCQAEGQLRVSVLYGFRLHSVDIHAGGLRIAVSLHHAVEFPAVSLIESYVVC